MLKYTDSNILATAGERLTECAADNLAPGRLVTVRSDIEIGTTIRELGLERDGVNAIGVEAFINHTCDLHEILDRIIGHNDVYRCERLLLIQAPDVELVD